MAEHRLAVPEQFGLKVIVSGFPRSVLVQDPLITDEAQSVFVLAPAPGEASSLPHAVKITATNNRGRISETNKGRGRVNRFRM